MTQVGREREEEFTIIRTLWNQETKKKGRYDIIKNKIHYTLFSLEKKSYQLQGCYTAQKMREDLLFPTHYDSYDLNNYRSLYATRSYMYVDTHSLRWFSKYKGIWAFFFSKKGSANERVETPVIVQMIWLAVR